MVVKQAIVYGSNGGIGSAIARKFLQNKFNLFLFSREEAKLKANIDELRQASSDSLVDGCAVDVCDAQSIESSVRYFQTAAGRSPISHLILCAGVNRDRLLIKETDSNIEHIIKTNQISSLNLCKQYVKLMLKQNQDSSIVLIGKAILFEFYSAFSSTRQTINFPSSLGLQGAPSHLPVIAARQLTRQVRRL